MKKVIFWTGVIVLILASGFYAFNSYIYTEKQSDVEVGETVTKTGKIIGIDSSQIAFDGPYLFTLESGGELSTIAVPSMGLPLCEAYKNNNIGDVSLFKNGDEVEVSGVWTEDGSIVPCESSEHYFRPTPLVVDDFEGEANPSSMNLEMKKWVWQSALYNDGREVKPKKVDTFTLTFKDGKFSATTDCNSAGGNYSSGTGTLTFSNIYSTLMYCEGSQEGEFTKLLTDTIEYHFTSKGELILGLKFDSGTVTFK